MKAIEYKEMGSAEVLELVDKPNPEPDANQVLIQAKAAGVNPVDWKLRSGSIPFSFLFRLKLPFVPGAEVAGVVEAVGKNISQFKVGDEVVGFHSALEGGAYAEKVLMKESQCQLKPAGIGFKEGAGAPLAALTAYQLFKGLPIEGKEVLVIGGSGGVGHFGVQIARTMGARVTAVASSSNQSFLTELGAEHVIAYDSSDYPDSLGNYDIVLDAVARHSASEMARHINRRGAYLNTLPNPSHFAEAVIRGIHYRGAMVESKQEDMQTLMGWLTTGQVKTFIDSSFSLSQAAEAHRHSEQGHARGKIVITMD
ncbi:MAG: hypothetical protein CMN76_03860 [Spirochaetaceae bacterium]|nr:hypothetical protein [Spirochaetaceae bacterium]|tara:strand:- start:234265 stop:235197 length:933 start_codon:yes stop_codon:yes gene_type:complete